MHQVIVSLGDIYDIIQTLLGDLFKKEVFSVISVEYEGDIVRPPVVSPQVAYFQSSLDKLNEAIKQSKVKILKHMHTDTHNPFVY